MVVAGDLNDDPQAATAQILHGPPGSEVGTGGCAPSDAGDVKRLWNTAGRSPRPVTDMRAGGYAWPVGHPRTLGPGLR